MPPEVTNPRKGSFCEGACVARHGAHHGRVRYYTVHTVGGVSLRPPGTKLRLCEWAAQDARTFGYRVALVNPPKPAAT